MTYCIGFKSKTAVFLIADSMTTSGKNQEVEETFGSYTTFGEFVEEEKLSKQDRMYKVFKLPGNVIATFAGDVKNAIEALIIFRKELEKGLKPISAFESVIAAGPFSDIELLVGFMDQNKPKLYSYNYMGNGKFKEEQSTIHLGSGKEHEYLSDKCTQIANFITNENWEDEQRLVFTLSFLQNFAIRNSLTSIDVGGFFYGAFVHTEGVQRISNTTYLMYAVTSKNEKKKLHVNHQVSLIRKNDFLLVSSSFLDHERFYFQDIDYEEKPNLTFLKNQVNDLRNEYGEGKFKYVILIDQLNYGLTICNLESNPSIVTIRTERNKDEITFGFRFSKDLENRLLNPPSIKEEYIISQKWDRNNPAHIELPVKWFL